MRRGFSKKFEDFQKAATPALRTNSSLQPNRRRRVSNYDAARADTRFPYYFEDVRWEEQQQPQQQIPLEAQPPVLRAPQQDGDIKDEFYLTHFLPNEGKIYSESYYGVVDLSREPSAAEQFYVLNRDAAYQRAVLAGPVRWRPAPQPCCGPRIPLKHIKGPSWMFNYLDQEL